MVVSAIAAMSKNRVIGLKGELPWHLPEDLKFFKSKTRDGIVIMGRKTFESISSKPLPHRYNIVISRKTPPKDLLNLSSSPTTQNLVFCKSLDLALEEARSKVGKPWREEVFIVGGGEIYRQALPQTDRIYLTVIHRDVEGDTFFPEFDVAQFLETARSDRSDPEPFSFLTYDSLRSMKD